MSDQNGAADARTVEDRTCRTGKRRNRKSSKQDVVVRSTSDGAGANAPDGTVMAMVAMPWQRDEDKSRI